MVRHWFRHRSFANRQAKAGRKIGVNYKALPRFNSNFMVKRASGEPSDKARERLRQFEQARESVPDTSGNENAKKDETDTNETKEKNKKDNNHTKRKHNKNNQI